MADDIKMLAEQALADAERATPGPWISGADPSHFDMPEVRNEKWAIYVPTDADASFIASARTREPKLAAAVLELLKENERLQLALDYPLASSARLTAADKIRELEWDNEDAYKRMNEAIRERDEARAALVESCDRLDGLDEKYGEPRRPFDSATCRKRGGV